MPKRSWTSPIRRAILRVFSPSIHDGFARQATSSDEWGRCTMSNRVDDDPRRLIQQARQGESEPLGRLLQMYRDYLLLLAESQLYGYRHASLNASDAVQETFLRAHAKFHQFQGATDGELAAWLRRILANSIVSLARQPLGLRRRSAVREKQLCDLFDRSSQAAEALFVAPDTSPSATVMRRERAILFAGAMQQLPEQYRQVIVLRHFQQLPFADVAQQMDRSVDSVEKLWIRALDRLRQLLRGALYGER
jgi:RNA polymerase sigma-70 factor (ECF subfamily)